MQRAFAVDLSPQDGFAPLVGTLMIRNRVQAPFSRIEIDAGDDGTVDLTLNAMIDDEARVDYTFNGAGTYVIKVTIYDAANKVIYQARRQIRVFDRAELAGKVVGTYYTMVERLAVSDAAGALRLFTGDAQARYADIFATLAADLPAVAADLRHLVDGVIGDDMAELTISRDTALGPTLFMVYLVRGRDGVWRIESLRERLEQRRDLHHLVEGREPGGDLHRARHAQRLHAVLVRLLANRMVVGVLASISRRIAGVISMIS